MLGRKVVVSFTGDKRPFKQPTSDWKCKSYVVR